VSAGTSATASAKKIAIFNHKGGVGKTTLTMNVASMLASLGRRVLLVDTDPQCNLTSYLVAEEVVDSLLDEADGANGQTIWSAIKPVSDALGGVRRVQPIETSTARLFLVPGDIRLSEFEADLNDFWNECLQRKGRGFRGTAAISELVNGLCVELEIDYVFYDSGPNIGPLNRAILLDCDYFVVPVACDLFSLRALKTLGRTLHDWINTWQTITELAPTSMPLLGGRPVFLGYIPERFKIYRGTLTQEHSAFVSKIDREINRQIVGVLREIDPGLIADRTKFALGSLKDFGVLVSASQSEGVPLYEVGSGSQVQRSAAYEAIYDISKTLDNYVRETA
jgi:cellulose biosynthesis protein BcsQ